MDSTEKANFINNLRFHIKNSNKGFEYFLEKWNELSKENRDSLKLALKIMCMQEMNNVDTITSSFFEFEKVSKYIDESETYFPDTEKFLTQNGANDKAIVKLFMELRSRGFIDNTNEEIAKLISNVFNIKYSTAYKYLKNPSEMGKTKNLLS